MSQSKLSSLAETCISIAIGFIISMIVTAVVFPLYGYPVSGAQNFQITCIFTVTSLVRGYFVRRWFNRLSGRQVTK